MNSREPVLPAQLLWGVFLFFQLMIVGLLVLLWNSRFPDATFAEMMSLDPSAFNNPAVTWLLVAAAGQLALGVIIPNLLKKNAGETSPNLTPFILRMVFFEACGLLGIVINVFSQSFLLGFLCVVAEMMAMLIFRPEQA